MDLVCVNTGESSGDGRSLVLVVVNMDECAVYAKSVVNLACANKQAVGRTCASRLIKGTVPLRLSPAYPPENLSRLR